MKKLVLILLLLPVFANAQFNYLGPGYESTTFTFASTDSLVHPVPAVFNAYVAIDTSGSTLWQIGNTLKPIFSNTVTASYGIMTDTMHTYPANANDFFVLKIFQPMNCIIDFWHKYQTDSLHAGGIVEFSTDSATWMNVATCPGIITQNFYTATDIIVSAQPAFTGTSSGEQLTRFQLMNCVAIKMTTTSCFPDVGFGFNPIYIRFRFVSDSTTRDSLSGWMIDSIKVEYTGCGGGVKNVKDAHTVGLYPNPAYGELTITATDLITEVSISNIFGQMVFDRSYQADQVGIDVADLPAGVYFVRINGSEVRKFVKEN